MKKFRIGCQEWCAFPDLNIEHVKAKVDTGAETSALHATNIEKVMIKGEAFVRFLVHPFGSESDHDIQCQAILKSARNITSSNGTKEMRYVIETTLHIGTLQRKIELTLTDRSFMRFNVLLGRKALMRFAIIDPSKKYLLGPIGAPEK